LARRPGTIDARLSQPHQLPNDIDALKALVAKQAAQHEHLRADQIHLFDEAEADALAELEAFELLPYL
jgi:hypothetical protein